MNGCTKFARHGLVVAALCVATVFGDSSTLAAADGSPGFSRSSIDVGLVVRDPRKVAKFYTQAIGFREVEGFVLSGSLARRIGLNSGTPLKTRVLVLSDQQSATRLKLIALPNAKGRAEQNITSGGGFRYVTVFVADIDRAMKRLQKAGVKLPIDGPVKLGDDSPREVFVLLVRDPEGNFVELVGPKGNGPAG